MQFDCKDNKLMTAKTHMTKVFIKTRGNKMLNITLIPTSFDVKSMIEKKTCCITK